MSCLDPFGGLGELPAIMPGEVHSVFISYASADRAAARLLRDTLAAAGLEVWLDEEELAGGEAWDAKIRNQIRTCTYFMPVISATTEARREGYFRREWRLAVERTLDLADDVMFLVPVVIDDTRDAGARVPEKFFAVQWLRTPGGAATPALQQLAQRLARGEAEAVPPAEPADEPPVERKAKKQKPAAAEPPPFPKFPAFPESGHHRGRFVYDLVLWFGHLVHSLWCHLPRWLRVIAAIVIIFNLISLLKPDPKPAPSSRRPNADVAAEVKQMLDAAGIKPRDRDRKGGDKLGALVAGAAEALQGRRPVTLITFDGDDKPASEYANEVFGQVCSELMEDGTPRWGLSAIPVKSDAPDAQIVARGARMQSRFVLTGHAGVAAPGLPVAFTVRLFSTLSGELVWKETYELEKHDADDVGDLIAVEVKKRLAEPAAAPPPPTPPGT